MVKNERTAFERWLADYGGFDRKAIREARSEYGYEVPYWDLAYAAWMKRAATSASARHE